MEPNDVFTPRTDFGPVQQALHDVQQAVRARIVGQTGFVQLLLAALLADGHVLIEGVPGVAKTLTAKLLARALDVAFARIQFTPDLMPSDILGTSVFNPQQAAFTFKRGPIFAQVVLIDEINRAPAKTQSALFEVMEERQVTVDGHTYPMEAPFVVLATQNPLEHEGTYRLPEAQLDRFLFKIEVGYPGLDDEVRILEHHQAGLNPHDLSGVPAVLSAAQVAEAQALVRRVHVEAPVLRYMAQIVHHTRDHPALYLGASPRASVALLGGGKAWAVLQGRDFVTPEDVQAVAPPVLAHRILLTPEQEMEGRRPADVVRGILESLEVPR